MIATRTTVTTTGNKDQTHSKCWPKGERQNAHLNFMDELQQMEHCAACQKPLPKSLQCQSGPDVGAKEHHDNYDDDNDADDADDDVDVGACQVGQPVVLPT